ncbi:MAG: NepR family anti-sigma factor [Pseudomonadota bacterium]
MTKRDKADKSQAYIEENLKRVFQETLDEEIPDRFKTLLDKLRDHDASTKSETGKDSK